MCLAIPGKIKKIEGLKATIEYPGETRIAFLGKDVEVREGDFVMVQMGAVIKKVSEREAKISWKAWKV